MSLNIPNRGLGTCLQDCFSPLMKHKSQVESLSGTDRVPFSLAGSCHTLPLTGIIYCYREHAHEKVLHVFHITNKKELMHYSGSGLLLDDGVGNLARIVLRVLVCLSSNFRLSEDDTFLPMSSASSKPR